MVYYAAPYALPLLKRWYTPKHSTPGAGRKWVVTKILIISGDGQDVRSVDASTCDITIDSTFSHIFRKISTVMPSEWLGYRVEVRVRKGNKLKKRIVLREVDADSECTLRQEVMVSPSIHFTAAVLDLGDGMPKFNITRRLRKYVIHDDRYVACAEIFPTDSVDCATDGRVCRIQFITQDGMLHNRRVLMSDDLSKLEEKAVSPR